MARYVTDPYAHIREAFRLVALGLMQWHDPAELTRAEYRRLEGLPSCAHPPARANKRYYPRDILEGEE